MNQHDLCARMSSALHQDIAALMPNPVIGASSTLALRRLQTIADHSPAVLTWLVEPWAQQNIADMLIRCARIHLYARILDDALDENLPIHRRVLLRAQPLFWSSVGTLAQSYPESWTASISLISETVSAVEQDDRRATPDHWGDKNHHLLIAPLLLSHGGEVWQKIKPALSDLIWLMQTGDEWRQGVLTTAPLKHQLAAKIENIMTRQTPAVLAEGGWHSAAERMLWEGKQLLAVLHA